MAPSCRSGNYAGEELRPALNAGKFTHIKDLIPGYNDGFVNTAPTGSFAVNRFGLFDMGGNVWQWCEDWYDKDKNDRTLRGGSWDDFRSYLQSSYRIHDKPGRRPYNLGFRCSLSASAPLPASGNSEPPKLEPTKSGVLTPPTASPSQGSPKPVIASGPAITTLTASKDAPFVNALGMKFVPVPIVGGPTNGKRVLFSIWDTRVQDYDAFVKETKRDWPKPDFPQGPTHPAVNVNWEDAQLFCQWLTARDRAAGRLPAEWIYRLPSDHEWSCAVGIGPTEDPEKLPADKNEKIYGVYPWGSQYQPRWDLETTPERNCDPGWN